MRCSARAVKYKFHRPATIFSPEACRYRAQPANKYLQVDIADHIIQIQECICIERSVICIYIIKWGSDLYLVCATRKVLLVTTVLALYFVVRNADLRKSSLENLKNKNKLYSLPTAVP